MCCIHMFRFSSDPEPIIETIQVPIESMSTSEYENVSLRLFTNESESLGVLSPILSEISSAIVRPKPRSVLLNIYLFINFN
jgi:hypothetical protein